MDYELQPGDVVQLKSGGPKMTVDTIGKFGMGSMHDEAKCVWFAGAQRVEALFELPTLVIETKGGPGAMSHRLQAGDVVQLRSGGPKMTVHTIGQFGMGGTHDEAKCVWSAGPKQMEALFELQTLEKS